MTPLPYKLVSRPSKAATSVFDEVEEAELFSKLSDAYDLRRLWNVTRPIGAMPSRSSFKFAASTAGR